MNDESRPAVQAHPERTAPAPAWALMLLAVLSLAAGAARAADGCPGLWSGLAHYAGSHETLGLLAEEEVLASLQALVGPELQHLNANLSVVAPVELKDCHLVASGDAAHHVSEEAAIVDLALGDGRITAAILSNRRIVIHTGDPVAAHLPASITAWIGSHRQYIDNGSDKLRIVLPRTDNVRVAASQDAQFAAAAQCRLTLDGQPTAAQRAAIERAAGVDLREMRATNGHDVALGVAARDLNDDGRPDLLVHFGHVAYCGTAGCSGIGLLATEGGYANRAFALPNFFESVTVLKTKHGNMHDLRFDDSRYAFTWKRGQYQ